MNRAKQMLGIAIMIPALTLAGTAHAKKHTKEKESETSCWPEVSATFDQESNTVVAESSKDLSNVVLLFSDGSTQRFESLDGLTGDFAGTGENAGKVLTGAWIKSGCNSSGDGPGYGEFFGNDDSATSLAVISIGNAPGVIEPRLTEVVEVWFEVSLSAMVPFGSEPVVVDYATRDGTTTAYLDYEPQSGTLVFEPGMITRTIAVLVYDDYVFETWEEFFYVDLSNPRNASIATGTGTGSILDDDGGDF